MSNQGTVATYKFEPSVGAKRWIIAIIVIIVRSILIILLTIPIIAFGLFKLLLLDYWIIGLLLLLLLHYCEPIQILHPLILK